LHLEPKIKKINEELENIKGLKAVSNVRQTGMIAAFEVELAIQNVSKHIFEEGIKNGVFLRPLGNTVYIMPPYCIENSEIEKIFDVIKKIITRQ
jgi:adenosylmethionine-8-amino-7-oxononanoate aminotransferase